MGRRSALVLVRGGRRAVEVRILAAREAQTTHATGCHAAGALASLHFH